jgi:CheY-like chemotaxis protein
MSSTHSPTPFTPHQAVGDAKGCVLLLEENNDTRNAMRNILTQNGIAVIEAANGAEAREAIQFGNNPLIVEVALINTEHTDGIQTIEFFKQQYPTISLIGLTGHLSDQAKATDRFNVVILGAGKGGSVLLELLSRLPHVEIIGIADKDPQAPGLKKAKELGIPIADHITPLISKSEVHLIVDVTGDSIMESRIFNQKHPNAEVLGGTAAKLLWDVVQHDRDIQKQISNTTDLATMVRKGIIVDFLVKPVESHNLVFSVIQGIEKRNIHET